MAVQFADRLRVLTGTTGTGTISLGGAVVGFRSFAAAVAAGALTSGATVYYVIEDIANAWEIGSGVYTAGSPDTLTRAVTASSVGGTTALPLTGGAQVYTTLTALSTVTAAITSGTISNTSIGIGGASSGAFTTLTSGLLTLNEPANSIATLAVSDTRGANLTLIGNGATTASKSIRAYAGAFDIVNSAYTAAILSLSDGGNLVAAGGIDSTAIGVNTAEAGTFLALTASTVAFGSTLGAKIDVYSTTYGVGINSSELTLFMPTGSVFALRNGGVYNGTTVWQIDSSGNETATSMTISGAIAATQPWVTSNYAILPANNNAGRNRFRNARFAVQQRNGPFTGVLQYTVDGWLTATGFANGNGSATGTVTATYAGGAAHGYANVINLSQPAVPVGYNTLIAQRIEAAQVGDLVGQTVTVSCYASATTSAGTLQGVVVLYYPTTVNNYGAWTVFGTVNVTVTSTPTRISATFANLPAGIANGLGCNLCVTQEGVAGNVSFTIGGLQLEVGSSASALEHLPYNEDIMGSQRWYQTISCSAGAAIPLALNFCDSNITWMNMAFAPTISFIAADANFNLDSGIAETVPSLFASVSTATASGYSNNSGRFEIVNKNVGETYALFFDYALSCEL